MRMEWSGALGKPGIGSAWWLLCIAAVAIAAMRWRSTARSHAAEAGRERRIRKELEIYARLEVSQAAAAHAGQSAMEAAKGLGRRVCQAITERSIFGRVAVLLRDAEGRLICVGRAGVDDLTLAALHGWGQKQTEEEVGGAVGESRRRIGESIQRDGAAMNGARRMRGARSFSISLGDWRGFDPEVGSWALSGRRERRKARRAMAVPFRNGAGRMLGAIVLCADGADFDEMVLSEGLVRALGPIEALAGRIAATLENEALAERLLRAEKLAGLGQLAGGVAHALNNPLTAVLGFAELIAESAADARVREDARTILCEAVKMKETVGRLIEFWRPTTVQDEQVEVAAMLHELTEGCEEKLRERGLRLELVVPENLPTLRGSPSRLRQVMEHLLNNAAQAIAQYRPLEDGEAGHSIRVTVSFDEQSLHLIVSDTGPGFMAPARAFDPFYTTQGTDAGAGMGLSICYGIVREHGGTISAFNLHPHGAAVVVELPRRAAVEETPADVSGENQQNALFEVRAAS